jgi:hypothetical protein
MTTQLDGIKYKALVTSCEQKASTLMILLDVAEELGFKEEVDKYALEYDNACIRLQAAKVLLENYELENDYSKPITQTLNNYSKACLTLMKHYCLYKDIQRHLVDQPLTITIILGEDAVTFTINNERLDISSASSFVKTSKVFT